MKLFNYATAMVIALCTAQASMAATTTLTFDEFPHQTVITTQYQSDGVIASGVRAFDQNFSSWPANTGTNLAYSQEGLMTFTLDNTILGDVTTVSAYISGDTAVGLYAYDANGVLVGQSITAGATNNQLVTVTSSGAPIATVTIHDGGSTFAIDTLSFTTPEAPVCTDVIQKLYDQVNALPDSAFKNTPALKRKKLLAEITEFKRLVSIHAADYKLRDQLYQIRYDINDWIKPSTTRTDLQGIVNQLLTIVDSHQC